MYNDIRYVFTVFIQFFSMFEGDSSAVKGKEFFEFRARIVFVKMRSNLKND